MDVGISRLLSCNSARPRSATWYRPMSRHTVSRRSSGSEGRPTSTSPSVTGVPAEFKVCWTLSPGRDRVILYLRLVVLLDALFVAVYGTLNWLTSLRHDALKLFFDWETDIPFVPSMIGAYLSITALFFLPVFALDKDELRLLARRIALAIVISGLAYLLLPSRLGFDRPPHVPGYGPVFRLLYALDGPHNLMPSLHVAYSTLIIASVSRPVTPAWLRRLLSAWLAIICVAAVLVHQHHIVDVVGGMLVTWASLRATR